MIMSGGLIGIKKETAIGIFGGLAMIALVALSRRR